MNKEHIKSLLYSYSANTIDRSGYEELMRYIARSEADQELYKLMEETWNGMNEEYAFDDIQQELLYQRIIEDPRFVAGAKTPSKPVYAMRRWMAVAASLLLLAGIGFLANYYLNRPLPLQAVVYQEKIVPFGKKLQIELPDGTEVWVNSGSKLKYPVSFAANKRELYLEGEAYFDVVHDTKRPFVIHTGTVTTNVLGTAFNIKAYGAKEVKVTVTRGKVGVGLSKHLLGVLTPNTCLSYDKLNGVSRQYNVDASRLRWMNGDLIFDNTTMEDAAETLERWYNIKIAFSGPKLMSRQFSASFLHNEHIEQVLRVLGELNHFTYTQDGLNFTLKNINHK